MLRDDDSFASQYDLPVVFEVVTSDEIIHGKVEELVHELMNLVLELLWEEITKKRDLCQKSRPYPLTSNII